MITMVRLRDLLYIDGGVFFNRVCRGKLNGMTEAGCKRSDGYTVIMIDKQSYLAHHLMWLWHSGELPSGYDIDHIDMDRSNNHISNLRKATRSQNMMNTKAHKDSKSGIKNVFFRKDTNKWAVRLTVNGKYKSFGCFDDLELAELVANEAREKYHAEFANV